MCFIRNNIIISFILFFCFSALCTAYFIEYVLGHKPCNLCIIERVPYILAILTILLGFLFKGYKKFALLTLSLIFFLASVISFYHFGIEQGFIEESLVCDLKINSNVLTKEALLDQLKQSTVSCKDVTFRIFGLTLATINIVISLVLSAISFKLFLNNEKNK
jgi:disulfide bond formation protein DsbB